MKTQMPKPPFRLALIAALSCTLNVKIHAQAPIGACCDPINTECNAGADASKPCVTNADCAAPGKCEAVCRVTTEANCPWPPPDSDLRPQWKEGAACEPDPFGHTPCGVAACCHKQPSPDNPNVLDEVCDNLTKNQCESAPPLDQPRQWQLGEYCGLGAQACPRNHCLDQIPRYCDYVPCPPLYCVPPDQFCCEDVCSSGPDGAYCCNVGWDSICCQLVEALCRPVGPHCPVGEITFINPPEGVVDARRPSKPNSPSSRQGISSFSVIGPPDADSECWSFCDSAENSGVEIAWMSNEWGFIQFGLNKPLVAGSVALLTYRDNNGHARTGRFYSHPGNANGDGRANAADILALVDHLNGVKLLPWGLYSGDLNHSGVIEPSDVLTLIDLLNGANGFAVWYGTEKPEGECP